VGVCSFSVSIGEGGEAVMVGSVGVEESALREPPVSIADTGNVPLIGGAKWGGYRLTETPTGTSVLREVEKRKELINVTFGERHCITKEWTRRRRDGEEVHQLYICAHGELNV
jgi:hypothetical protein